MTDLPDGISSYQKSSFLFSSGSDLVFLEFPNQLSFRNKKNWVFFNIIMASWHTFLVLFLKTSGIPEDQVIILEEKLDQFADG